MDALGFLKEAAAGSLRTVLLMGAIIFPLMVLLEFLNSFSFWREAGKKLRGLRELGMSEAAAFPLLTGLVFGLLYGAGVIIEEARAKNLAPREVWMLNLFLGLTHAVIEDTAIFCALGANFLVIFFGRLGLTVFLIYFLAKLFFVGRRSGFAGSKNPRPSL